MSWLRLPDFEASDPELVHDDGHLVEVLVHVKPVVTTYPICCLAPKIVKNGTKTVRYRDRRIEPAPTWLVVKRQRAKCQTCDATLYQQIPHVDDDHYITERLRDDLRMSAVNRPFRDAVRMHAVEETLVRRVFRTFADQQLVQYRYKAPRVLGIDENNLLGDMRGVIVDVEKARLLDVYPGRTQSDIRRGFDRMEDWENVEVWCQDMAGHYKGLAKDLFPKAAVVIDKFHVLTKANHWWSKVRLSETPKLPVEIRKKLPGLIRVFDQHWEVMTRRQQDRVAEVLEHSERLKMAWTIKESFYYFYEAPNRQDAESAYGEWVQFAMKNDQHAEWKPLMTMMQRWRKEIFNYFDHRYTSGVVERVNRSIGDINRAANGMDFQTLRAKAILRYGNLIPEDRFKHFFLEMGDAVAALLAPYLEPDAHLDDDEDGGRVLLGSGVDLSTLIADLEAGRF